MNKLIKLLILENLLFILYIIKHLMESPEPKKNFFSIMSYNVRCCNDTLRFEKDGSIVTRSKYLINNILIYKPDSVGFQEVTSDKKPSKITWYSLLSQGLSPLYEGVGDGRDSNRFGESCPIFYNKEKLDLLESGTKWLSENPDKPGSKFANTKNAPSDGLPRVMTYVIVKNKITGNKYMHVNTHLDYKEASNRIRQIKVLVDFVSKFKDKYPIILTGDLNTWEKGYALTKRSEEEIAKEEEEKFNIKKKENMSGDKTNMSNYFEDDAVDYLIHNGFVSSSYEAKEADKHWTFPTINYFNGAYYFCKERGYHTNGKKIGEQPVCTMECDKERGNIIDHCMRNIEAKMYFSKYKVVTDCEKCGGISSDHYPIYIEGYFFE